MPQRGRKKKQRAEASGTPPQPLRSDDYDYAYGYLEYHSPGDAVGDSTPQDSFEVDSPKKQPPPPQRVGPAADGERRHRHPPHGILRRGRAEDISTSRAQPPPLTDQCFDAPDPIRFGDFGSVEDDKEEEVELQAAYMRISSRAVLCSRSIPEHTTAAADGYAISLAYPGGTRKVVPPGQQSMIDPGSAIWADAGDLLPQGVDAVVDDDVKKWRDHYTGQTMISFNRPPLPGQHVIRPGQLGNAGELIVGAGQLLRAGELQRVKDLGQQTVWVKAPPRSTNGTGADPPAGPPGASPLSGLIQGLERAITLGMNVAADAIRSSVCGAMNRTALLMDVATDEGDQRGRVEQDESTALMFIRSDYDTDRQTIYTRSLVQQALQRAPLQVPHAPPQGAIAAAAPNAHPHLGNPQGGAVPAHGPPAAPLPAPQDRFMF
eukprot:TRINITY_DN10961_c0_g1_i1.p1 TRINITY_DN10961_c0_g1~~TRINITY_DN10961_c0_g1_i1.p1  ORF type:complete len:433 (+),score=80.46 TRINITY_DN10961_c0_g1_i1:143-1441(+)